MHNEGINQSLIVALVKESVEVNKWKGCFYGTMAALVGTVIYYEVKLHKEKKSKTEWLFKDWGAKPLSFCANFTYRIMEKNSRRNRVWKR